MGAEEKQRILSVKAFEDFKADIYSFGVVCWNVLTGGIKDQGGDWSTPCCPFSAHSFTKLANNHKLLEKYATWTQLINDS